MVWGHTICNILVPVNFVKIVYKLTVAERGKSVLYTFFSSNINEDLYDLLLVDRWLGQGTARFPKM